MITAPNTYKVNLDAIKFLSKMLRKPLASSIIGLAALNEFSALLKEQLGWSQQRSSISKKISRLEPDWRASSGKNGCYRVTRGICKDITEKNRRSDILFGEYVITNDI